VEHTEQSRQAVAPTSENFPSAQGGWQNFDVTPASLWGDGLTTASDQAGSRYTTIRNIIVEKCVY
jgi:hypothetical protein